ncbi:hypothetical protein WB403_52105, partial [Streptomyces brasiliscabiei]
FRVATETNEQYIKESNLSDERMTLLSLVKAGYGSLAELESLDTTEYLDIIEFEEMSAKVQAYKIEQARQ